MTKPLESKNEDEMKYLIWNLVDHYQNDHPDADKTRECRFAIETIDEIQELIAKEYARGWDNAWKAVRDNASNQIKENKV
jgi:hypothetical protein